MYTSLGCLLSTCIHWLHGNSCVISVEYMDLVNTLVESREYTGCVLASGVYSWSNCVIHGWWGGHPPLGLADLALALLIWPWGDESTSSTSFKLDLWCGLL